VWLIAVPTERLVLTLRLRTVQSFLKSFTTFGDEPH